MDIENKLNIINIREILFVGKKIRYKYVPQAEEHKLSKLLKECKAILTDYNERIIALAEDYKLKANEVNYQVYHDGTGNKDEIKEFEKAVKERDKGLNIELTSPTNILRKNSYSTVFKDVDYYYPERKILENYFLEKDIKDIIPQDESKVFSVPEMAILLTTGAKLNYRTLDEEEQVNLTLLLDEGKIHENIYNEKLKDMALELQLIVDKPETLVIDTENVDQDQFKKFNEEILKLRENKDINFWSKFNFISRENAIKNVEGFEDLERLEKYYIK